MGEAAFRRMSYAEYLDLERNGEVKHSWLDGQVLAMAGGTPLHSLLAANLIGAFLVALRGRPCRAYTSDLRIRSLADGLATYPDLSVICGRVETHPEDRQAATNPVVLVEVLSDGTEAGDRRWKLPRYRQMESVRDLLLVHAARELVEHYRRNDDGTWIVTDHVAGEVTLSGVPATLALADLYAGAELARSDADPP